MFEVIEPETGEGQVPDYRVFVTDGKDSFHIDAPSAQRLCELLNAAAKTVRINKANTK